MDWFEPPDSSRCEKQILSLGCPTVHKSEGQKTWTLAAPGQLAQSLACLTAVTSKSHTTSATRPSISRSHCPCASSRGLTRDLEAVMIWEPLCFTHGPLHASVWCASRKKKPTRTQWVPVCETPLLHGILHFFNLMVLCGDKDRPALYFTSRRFSYVSVFLCITEKRTQCQVCETSLPAEILHFF